MRLWIRSDLHFSLAELADSFQSPPPHDVAVLAGDLAAGLQSQIETIDRVVDRPVVLVAGNHEYWHRTMPTEQMSGHVADFNASNVNWLDRRVWRHNGVRFVGCTLWTDFALYGPDARAMAMEYARRENSDFSLIIAEPPSPLSIMRLLFSPERARELHMSCRRFLRDQLSKPFDGPTVVVTHHAPSLKSVSREWRDDPGTPAYASRLDDLIRDTQPDLWIHGHVHSSSDYQIGKTRVVCNPAGIAGENEAYDPSLVIEI